jgi:hypothetical protein
VLDDVNGFRDLALEGIRGSSFELRGTSTTASKLVDLYRANGTITVE